MYFRDSRIRDEDGKLNAKTLYAINTKKEDAAAEAAPVQYGLSSSTIKIPNLLNSVKNYFPNELPQDVADNMWYVKDKSDFEGLKYSITQPNAGGIIDYFVFCFLEKEMNSGYN